MIDSLDSGRIFSFHILIFSEFSGSLSKYIFFIVSCDFFIFIIFKRSISKNRHDENVIQNFKGIYIPLKRKIFPSIKLFYWIMGLLR